MYTFLSYVFGFVYRVWADLIGLVAPLFTTERLEKMAFALWFTLHILLVIAITIGLWALDNFYLRIHRFIPGALPLWFKELWMPILWLLFYLVLILCYVLYHLMTRDESVGYYQDIDDAWRAGVEALRKNNLELGRLPLFLILGRAEAGDNAIFTAAGLPLELRQTPAGDAPVHVYATAKAIFVTCPGASVLGGLSAWLHGEGIAISGGLEEDGDNKTLKPGQSGGGRGAAEVADLLARAGGNPANLNPIDRRRLRFLDRQDNAAKARARSPDVLEEDAARLRYLCSLMVRDRAPLCALNGILVLLPYAGLDTAQDAAYTADACARDLTAARQVLGVHCQVLAVVCDMESAPGFAELVARFPENQRKNRIGQGTPLVPRLKDGPGGGPATMYRSLARWICRGVMRYWVLTKCQLEKAPGGMVPDGLDVNTSLFLLLDDMTEREGHLAEVLEKGLSTYAPPDRMLFGGCYVAGTGRDRATQAFMYDVFDKLIKGDEHVYWTDEVASNEYWLNGWINFGWAALAVAALVTGALVLLAFNLRPPAT